MRKLMMSFAVVSAALALTAVGCGDDSETGSGGTGTGGAGPGSGGGGVTGTGGGSVTGTGGAGTGGSAVTGTGGSAPVGGYCGVSCTAPADCCPAGVPDCPGAYPSNWTCDDGVCGAPQCSTDDECTFGGALPDYKCLDGEVSGTTFKLCAKPCTGDGDCMAPLTCIGEDANGGKFCSAEAAGCENDDDCADFGKCDTASGACYCDADTDCSGTTDVCVQ